MNFTWYSKVKGVEVPFIPGVPTRSLVVDRHDLTIDFSKVSKCRHQFHIRSFECITESVCLNSSKCQPAPRRPLKIFKNDNSFMFNVVLYRFTRSMGVKYGISINCIAKIEELCALGLDTEIQFERAEAWRKCLLNTSQALNFLPSPYDQ